jgi:RimJ/RimL family protein N-acetyltransferase
MSAVATTERLKLVMPATRHLDAYIGWCTSARCAARGWNVAPNQAWRDFAGIIGHHALMGFGPYVAETHDGGPVGLFGAWQPLGQAEHEIKWTLWADADEGRGYAFEAAQAARSHAYTAFGWTGAVSYINSDNSRSAALAARLGAVRDGTWTTPSGKVVDVWRHPGPGVAP